MRILLVEDDPELARRLVAALRKEGYVVDHASDGSDGQFLGEEQEYALVVLDLGLPMRPGLEVLRAWRDAGNPVPVLILTARDSWQERVDGLKAGADDYLGKPFHQEELLARVQALIRRHHQAAGPRLTAAGLVLDESHQTLTTRDGAQHALTATEFRLLRAFMLSAGRLLSKSQLAEHIYDNDERDGNVIEVYVRRLRRLIGRDMIETRRNQGYVFRK